MSHDRQPAVNIAECRSLLMTMESAFRSLKFGAERPAALKDTLGAIRAINAGLHQFGLHHVVVFTLALEGVLSDIDNGKIELGADLISLLLSSRAHLAMMMNSLEAGNLLVSQLHAHLAEAAIMEDSDAVDWHLR
jgi:chemotaxis protein histidine kinase CheA